MRRMTVALAILIMPLWIAAQNSRTGLGRLLDSELARFPAKAGVWTKHLTTGEEAGVRADEAFNSFSVIKVGIMAMAFNLSEQKKLNLDERVEIRRAHVRDGSGMFQYHDYGLNPTIRDVITEMIITSDNTATDIMVERVGGFDALNSWMANSGYPKMRMLQHGWQWRRKLMTLYDAKFKELPAEQVVGLMYGMQSNGLFSKYADLFAGPRQSLLETVRSADFRQKYNAARDQHLSDNPDFWLGTMTPREVGRMLEAIQKDAIASPASCEEMRQILRRQQAGTRRIPHFLNVPVGHKTGDGPPNIANDVGIVYARSGPIVISFFTANNKGPYAETEDLIGRVSQRIVDYFDGSPQ